MRSMGNSRPKLSSYGERRLISYWAGARADLSLRWPHMPFLGIGGGVCRNPNFTVTWCTDLEKLWVSLTFRSNSENLLTVIKELAIAWMLCGGLRAWLSARSLLMTVLHSLIARRRFGPQTQWRPLRKTLASGLGLDDVSLPWPAVVQLFVFICSGMQ